MRRNRCLKLHDPGAWYLTYSRWRAHNELLVSSLADIFSPKVLQVSKSLQSGRFQDGLFCRLVMWAHCFWPRTAYLPQGQQGIGVFRQKHQILLYNPTWLQLHTNTWISRLKWALVPPKLQPLRSVFSITGHANCHFTSILTSGHHCK